MSYFPIFVHVKIVAELSSRAQLCKIVIQGLFRNANTLGSRLQGHPVVEEIFVVVAIIESAPLRDFLNDIADVAFTAALLFLPLFLLL